MRVRGAYANSGAALHAEIGGTTVFHETFIMPDASGASNLSVGMYDGAAAPFLRIAFVPPGKGAQSSENTGLAPILMRLPWPDTKLPKNFARPAPSPFAILFIRSQFRNCERQGVGRKGGRFVDTRA